MSDIVERLRDAQLNHNDFRFGWLAEASDEIERLRARNKRLEEALIRLLQHLPPVYMIADEPDTETLYAAALERARAALEDK